MDGSKHYKYERQTGHLDSAQKQVVLRL